MRGAAGLALAALAMAQMAMGAGVSLTAAEQARLGDFEAALAAQPSATRALTGWCAARGIANPARIVAEPVPGDDAGLPRDLWQVLDIGNAEPLGYRHVRLRCGGTVLSEAHNWYVPGRLTDAMRRVLATTDTPFGTVAAPLGFVREPLASRRGAGPGCPAETVLTHRALLRLPDGRPLALLVECYARAVVAG